MAITTASRIGLGVEGSHTTLRHLTDKHTLGLTHKMFTPPFLKGLQQPERMERSHRDEVNSPPTTILDTETLAEAPVKSIVARPTKRKKLSKSNAVVSTKPHTIFALTDEKGQIRYIGSTVKNNVRAASLGVAAPMLRIWILSVNKNYPNWDWSQHIKILARNVPADRVRAFKTMLMSDNQTFWSENNGKCNMHAQGIAGIEHEFSSMREELETGFATTSVTPLQAAEVDEAIMADIDEDTRDENGSIPSIRNALIERQQYLQTLHGSPFEQKTKAMVDKYQRGGCERTNLVPLEEFITDLNGLVGEGDAYKWSSPLEKSMHDEAMALLKRLRVHTGNGTKAPEVPITYNMASERLKLLMSAIRHRDNINAQSFQSQMAWTQPTFKLKPSGLPQGYEVAIGHAQKTLDHCTDLTAWQRKQMESRLNLLKRMQRDDEPIASCPLRI